MTAGLELEFALMLLETQLQIYIALQAPDRIFVTRAWSGTAAERS